LHAQSVVRGDVEGAHVEAELGRGGDPPLLHLQQFLDQPQQLLAVEIGQGESLRGSLQPHHVARGAEESNLSLAVPVGLESLETLDAVVEGGAEGVEL
jgi:hypothetical protein